MLKGQLQKLCNDLSDAKKFEEEHKANIERQKKQYELIMRQRRKDAKREKQNCRCRQQLDK